jgi:hypothetical protein
MDRPTRDHIQSATQAARAVLEQDYAAQLQGDYDILPDGTIGAQPGAHLDATKRTIRRKLVAAVERRVATARNASEGVGAYVREAAFTTLNRFVALKMLEVRGLVPACVTGGEQAAGFKEFGLLAPGLDSMPDKGYRLYIESLCDEVAREVRVLFDRTDPASLLWPRRTTLLRLFELLNADELRGVWAEDETIGWVYQYFNSKDERQKMRDPKRGGSQAPRDAHELAVRNQFFTPRYVVEFLVDNTLGRTWWEMRPGRTALAEACRYMVRPPDEPPQKRDPKDPRELRIIDPACGSGHFLLYAFELLETIYEEAWLEPELGPPLWKAAGWTQAPTEARTAVVGEPRLDPALPPHCFSCGAGVPAAEAVFFLWTYQVDRPAGRPFVYCPRCADSKHVDGLRLPLHEFDYARACRDGWFEEATGLQFLDLARAFRFQAEVPEAREALPLLRRVRPGWILAHNLHGVDIDARAAQIAALALWMRAQRALKETPKPRPRIDRTNIVVAEPIPGDVTMRAEVAAKLPEAMRPIFARVLDEMALAGDAGTLLRVERAVGDAVAEARKRIGSMPRQMTLGSWQKQAELLTEARVWETAEESIIAALREYAAGATDSAGLRRRMFQHDAGQGLAFVEVCQKKYDVVLMNPPFGAASLRVKREFERAYPRSKNDVYAAFVERGVELLTRRGRLGAITSRTAFFLSYFKTWREKVLLDLAPPTVFVDLGAGVLDSAMVETAAYCLELRE